MQALLALEYLTENICQRDASHRTSLFVYNKDTMRACGSQLVQGQLQCGALCDTQHRSRDINFSCTNLLQKVQNAIFQEARVRILEPQLEILAGCAGQQATRGICHGNTTATRSVQDLECVQSRTGRRDGHDWSGTNVELRNLAREIDRQLGLILNQKLHQRRLGNDVDHITFGVHHRDTMSTLRELLRNSKERSILFHRVERVATSHV
mmetsp:Transcript_37510/g.94290  ORF Transcript_37510/g.94290 Transcript_37510/m.94290 type:complete len:209 (-) Transcript_37510:374-1000(-)